MIGVISCPGGTRQKLRGWSRNLGKDSRQKKERLLTAIQELDKKGDSTGLDDDEWAYRYHLEDQLLQIYRLEEEYWRQRGRIRWALQGDANTAYFHAIANGKRCRCNISSLTKPDGTVITGKTELQEHIYDYYRELLGSTTQRLCGLAANTWATQGRVSQADNDGLALTFTEEELEAIMKDMKSDTAPGPDGFPVPFFKKCWPLVKHGILHILNDFILGRIDISRLNFGVLTLIPKVQGAENISQFRPIALINVVFKIISKAFASRLDPIANRVISPNQTAFIKGRYILDGALALHEIVHELKSKKLGASCLS